MKNHTHTYIHTQKKLLAAFRPKILYENNTKITLHTLRKRKLMISLLDLEKKNYKKSIIYKALSEKEERKNNLMDM